MEHRWVRRPISFSCTAVTAGPANHIETTPRSLDTPWGREGVWRAHRDRTRHSTSNAALWQWCLRSCEHGFNRSAPTRFDVIPHNQSGNCAEKGFKRKVLIKCCHIYYVEGSIGFKMALRVDITRWCHPQWLGSSPYDAKESKNCRPFIVGWVGGPVWILSGILCFIG